DLSRERTRGILEEAARAPGSRIGDFYASFMDEGAVNSAGIAPIRPMLDEIRNVADRGGWAAELGKLARRGVRGPFVGYIGSDEHNPDVMIVHLFQSGLGLPDRDYYLSDSPDIASKRTAYQAYLTRLLTLAGESNAQARAAAVVAFEHDLAEVQWT